MFYPNYYLYDQKNLMVYNCQNFFYCSVCYNAILDEQIRVFSIIC